jgi:hypothetical protein
MGAQRLVLGVNKPEKVVRAVHGRVARPAPTSIIYTVRSFFLKLCSSLTWINLPALNNARYWHTLGVIQSKLT